MACSLLLCKADSVLTIQLKRNTPIIVFYHLNQSRPSWLLDLGEIYDFFFLSWISLYICSSAILKCCINSLFNSAFDVHIIVIFWKRSQYRGCWIVPVLLLKCTCLGMFLEMRQMQCNSMIFFSVHMINFFSWYGYSLRFISFNLSGQ